MLRTLIVDDHEVVREGLAATLDGSSEVVVVGSAGTGADALVVARRALPDLALVDLRLPDMTGTELCSRLRRVLPSISVIVLSGYLSEETVRGAFAASAAAYVTKSAGLHELRAAIRRVAAGRCRDAEEVPARVVEQLHGAACTRSGGWSPTPHQEQVLELAAQGLTNREIGNRLFISESTVRFHVQNLKQRFSARTRTELVARTIRLGVIAPALEDVAWTS